MARANKESASVVLDVQESYPHDSELKRYQEAQRQHMRDLHEHGRHYNNAVILGGYVAFFALWAGAADSISTTARLTCVVLMTASLLIYLSFEFWQLALRMRVEAARADAFAIEDIVEFDAKWQESVALQHRIFAPLEKLWLPQFAGAIGLGSTAALVLGYNALAVLLDLPQLWIERIDG